MKRSKHNLSCYKLASMDMGKIIPIHVQEVLPGDTIQHSTSALIRVAPMLAPVMHPTKVHIHHFFVPYRLIWDDWEDFITKGRDGLQAPAYPVMEFGGGGVTVGSLHDYFGLPTGINLTIANGMAPSALPVRAYQTICNEYYRDNQIIDPYVVDTTSGTDTTTSVAIQAPAWEKDPITVIRPDPQLGPDITIPLADDNPPVKGIGKGNQNYGSGGNFYETGETGATAAGDNQIITGGAADTNFYVQEDPSNAGFPNIRTDLSGAMGSINELREAFAMQRWEEARNTWGSRYTEYLRYLGVKSSDARLQRPEYLGGGKQTIQFSEVVATAETGTSVDVGDLKGHGIASMRSNRYRRFFEEHGLVMTLMYVRPKSMYVQGISRLWSKRSPEEYWQKELQFIGDETVLNNEVYAGDSAPLDTFGFRPRYEDYRHNLSSVGGEFRSALNYWHMARIFAGDVAINEDFIKCTPTTRIFASTSTDPLYVMANHSIQARRLIAQSGTERRVL